MVPLNSTRRNSWKGVTACFSFKLWMTMYSKAFEPLLLPILVTYTDCFKSFCKQGNDSRSVRNFHEGAVEARLTNLYPFLILSPPLATLSRQRLESKDLEIWSLRLRPNHREASAVYPAAQARQKTRKLKGKARFKKPSRGSRRAIQGMDKRSPLHFKS